ncbi:MAG: ABC transporter substrate-binding protein [Devosia sp.]
MTWSHPRGYDPMVATAAEWKKKTGVEVVWEKRSLQDFESYPVEELARAYDMIVIDHPHVGQITAEQCLTPLDLPERATELATLAGQSVGQSFESYRWQGHLWALPIDAATQVMGWRADKVAPPKIWSEVMDLAIAGHVLLPMRPPHSLMSFFTLTANLGHACNSQGGPELVDRSTGVTVLRMLAELCALLPDSIYQMDPIAASAAIAETDSEHWVVPLMYGYVNYAFDGFVPNRVTFGNIPAAGRNGPIGGTLGGTGIAVSAFSKNRQAAIDHAFWLASAELQRTLYAAADGQPGNAVAWDDDAVNTRAHDFYRGTRDTLEGSYVRPRHNGYMGFQDAASKRINEGLRSGEAPERTLDALQALYSRSLGG